MTQFISKLLYVTRGNHKSLVAMMFLFLFTSGLEVFGTGIVGPFIAIATNPKTIKSNHWLNLIYEQLNFNSYEQFLAFLSLVVISVFCIKAYFSFNAQKAVCEFGFNLRAKLSYQLMKAYLEAPYSYHLHANSATLIQNVMTSTDQVCSGLVTPLLTSVSNLVILLALLLLLVKTDSMALILIALILLVALMLLHPLKNRLARWGKQGVDASIKMYHVANHGLGSLKETRVLGCESYFAHQMENQTKSYAINSSLAASYGNLPRFVIEAFMISFLIGFTLLFVNLNQGNGQNLTSVLGIFALASIRLLPAVGNLISGINVIRYNTYALDRLFLDFKELDKESLNLDFTNNSTNLDLNREQKNTLFTKKITIEKLTYSYPRATKKALEEISLTIQKGESIGLIGKSGSGKTTLVDVILGLFMPQSGDIKVDGVSVYKDLRAWQNLLGYVPQSIFLMDDTLEKNIAFGVPDEEVDSERLKRAIEMAQLSEVVEQLPHGIDTVVGERGVLLSGGQRQRVGIARVLYHEREILIFDEATAALDTETEKLITEATKSLSGLKTIIIIAHRFKTIEHCDRIYQLDRGQIIKSGSYQTVVLGE